MQTTTKQQSLQRLFSLNLVFFVDKKGPGKSWLTVQNDGCRHGRLHFIDQQEKKKKLLSLSMLYIVDIFHMIIPLSSVMFVFNIDDSSFLIE
jgi:hypothetical protein